MNATDREIELVPVDVPAPVSPARRPASGEHVRLWRRRRSSERCTTVSFPELVWAHFLWRNQLAALAGDAERRTLDVPLEHPYRARLLGFQREQGSIVQAYWCSKSASAAAITVLHASRFQRKILRREFTYRFHTATDWQTASLPWSASLLQECETLAIRVSEVLRGTSQWIALRWIMSVASYLLGRTDATPNQRRITVGNRDGRARAEAHARKALAAIETYYLDAAGKSARMVYVWGMLQGIALLAVVPMLVAAYLFGFDLKRVHDADTQQLITAYMAGAVGALISVMVRMTDGGGFTIDSEIGRRGVRRLGAFRVVVGAIFATAIYAALRGGLLQLTVPAGGKAVYFYAFVSFIAGFSERWAQVILGGAERMLVSSPDPSSAHQTASANGAPATDPSPRTAPAARNRS